MEKSLRIVQIKNTEGRRIALVDEPELILINNFESVYQLAVYAMDSAKMLADLISENLSAERLDYHSIYEGKGVWKLLPSFDNPDQPWSCLVSGTGLTHKNSALNRQMMHGSVGDKPTDSMQMYQWGVGNGNPDEGQIGVQPEWFYKGNGAVLKAHGDVLKVPPYANDGGEEPEVAGIYIVDKMGNPCRIGFTTGNEFSDHVMEKKNYLYLAPSKLRDCAIGPELVINESFAAISGKVSVIRNDKVLWDAEINTGEANMAHNLQNIEYHHFKYENHRMPYQSHVHFFGADAFSFGNKVTLLDGDEMRVEWDGLGRAIVNKLKIMREKEIPIGIRTL